MHFTSRMVGEVVVLTMTEHNMDGTENEEVRTKINELVEHKINKVVIDLSRVKWLNSSGLGTLIGALNTMRLSKGDLHLACLDKRIQQPLHITKLDTVFEQFPTVSAAVKSFNK